MSGLRWSDDDYQALLARQAAKLGRVSAPASPVAAPAAPAARKATVKRLGPEARVKMLAERRPLTAELILDFDLPPSANKAWRNIEEGKGRVRSDTYKDWIKLCCTQLSDARIPRVDGEFSVLIEARRPAGAKGALRDIDNIIKPTLDLLHGTGMTADDRKCMEVTARWISKPTNVAGIVVVIRSWKSKPQPEAAHA